MSNNDEIQFPNRSIVDPYNMFGSSLQTNRKVTSFATNNNRVKNKLYFQKKAAYDPDLYINGLVHSLFLAHIQFAYYNEYY